MSRSTETSTLVRGSAVAAAAGLAVMSGMQLYWALGGTWVLHEASGGERDELSTWMAVASGVLAVALLVAALGVLGRAGFWGSGREAQKIRFHRITWLATIGLAVGSVIDLFGGSWERFAFGPIALVLSFLCYVVARKGVLAREPREPLPPFPAKLLRH